MNPYQVIIVQFCLGLPLSASHAEALEEVWGVALSTEQGLQAVKSQTRAGMADLWQDVLILTVYATALFLVGYSLFSKRPRS